MSDDLVADEMLPPYERLVEIHQRLDPPGTSLLSVEQLVENLLSRVDALHALIEHREAALGRALSLLRTAWDLSADRWPLIEKLRTHHLLDALEWRDVQDWVINEPKKEEEDVSDEVEQVMEVVGPSERAAAGVDESLARWRGHTDSELQMIADHLADGLLGQHSNREAIARARMLDEINAVQNRREAERASYRGPGRYRHRGGDVYEVLGTANGGSADPEVVIMRHSSGSYYYERWDNFEMPFDERPRYEYLGPLDERSADEEDAPS